MFRHCLFLFCSVLINLCSGEVFSVDLHKRTKTKETTNNIRLESSPYVDYFDVSYYANITIGTPPQEFRVQLTTATSEFWIISKDCQKDYCNVEKRTGYKHHKYDYGASSTHQKDGRYFNAQYNGGQAAGQIAKDTVRMGELAIENQLFGSVDTLSGYLTTDDDDGIMGLGWPSNAKDAITPPLYRALNLLDAPVFTVWLVRHDKLEKGEPVGAITYGGLDNAHCSSQVNYVPLSKVERSTEGWALTVEKISSGKVSIASKTAYLSDTSSPYIGVPEKIFCEIVNDVPVEFHGNYFTVNCTDVTKMRSVFITINGKEYEIPPTELVLEVQQKPGICILAVSKGPTPVLGEPFIRRYCHVYDIGQKRIGLAPSLVNVQAYQTINRAKRLLQKV